jgi:hypothetical protein
LNHTIPEGVFFFILVIFALFLDCLRCFHKYNERAGAIGTIV